MKIVVTYEAADITRLIRQDLARQGIAATDADVKYAKGSAVVSVEATPDDTPIVVEQPANVADPAAARSTPPTPSPSAPPKLEAVDGGANPVDMTDIFRQSQKIAASSDGKFPAPQQHRMLEGESHEFPGEKT